MGSSPGLILAVDCGSTTLKAALFAPTLERLGEGSVALRYAVQGGPEVEIGADDVWSAFRELAGSACAQAGSAVHAVTTVAFTSQAQTFALGSADGRRMITPFYSWMDRRAEAEAAELTATLGPDFHRHCSIAPPLPQLQLSKLLWVSRHVGGGEASTGRVITLPGFLAERLGVTNTTDRNLAAMGGAYSLLTGGWWQAALTACGVASERMPRLVDVGATVAATAAPYSELFRPEVAVTFAGNDQTAGAYGNACERGGMVVTLGTALVVYRHAGGCPGPYNPGGCWGPYPGGTYYELGTSDHGCQALDWARRQLLPGAGPAAFDAAARDVVEAQREAAAPFFQPSRIACGQPWSEPVTDTASAAYAVLEGISFALRRLLEVNLGAAAPLQEIAVIGGGGKSAVWLALLADVLGIPVSRGHGDALLGAAAMSAGLPPCTATAVGARLHRPDPARVRRLRERYRRWTALL